MGGKGKKRREKNYRSAHGDNTRLPPPPTPSSIDALPSKLRQLIAFTSKVDDEQQDKGMTNAGQKPSSEGDKTKKRNRTGKENGNVEASQKIDSDDANLHDSTDQQKRKRIKNTQVTDLRYLKAKKKKTKKPSAEDTLYAPKKDKVKFGDIVQAPPKLAVVPKAPKKPFDASQERLRLQAVESYRNRRQWMSRPGIHLPPPIEDISSGQ
ncbi:hypothetical protein V2J09_015558 [Rumex salicifolius]